MALALTNIACSNGLTVSQFSIKSLVMDGKLKKNISDFLIHENILKYDRIELHYSLDS